MSCRCFRKSLTHLTSFSESRSRNSGMPAWRSTSSSRISRRNVATEKLNTPTRDTRDIIAAAVRSLDRIWLDGHRYAKAGIMLNDFSPNGVAQLNLFDDVQPRPHSDALMKVLDGINHSGLGKVWFAGRGIAPDWQMKREMLSPAYTTRWKELPVARF
ncbi:DNA polymerase V subunit UmuC [Raoultella ornithinolytica]|nr:DNA polymerase V subunit UmuC [Raoultella ornithinolytica]